MFSNVHNHILCFYRKRLIFFSLLCRGGGLAPPSGYAPGRMQTDSSVGDRQKTGFLCTCCALSIQPRSSSIEQLLQLYRNRRQLVGLTATTKSYTETWMLKKTCGPAVNLGIYSAWRKAAVFDVGLRTRLRSSTVRQEEEEFKKIMDGSG